MKLLKFRTMSNKILFKFLTDVKNKDRNILFDRDSTIEQLLLTFFRETNCILTPDTDKISFLSKGEILNHPRNLKKNRFFL